MHQEKIMKHGIKTIIGILAIIAIIGCDTGTSDTPKVPLTYSVTYNGNGNSGGAIPTAQVKTEDIDLVLDANSGSLARKSFVFSGWNTMADGTGTDYASGATYTANAALTLYAKWVISPSLKIGFSQWQTTANWPKTQCNSIKNAIMAKSYTIVFNDANENQTNQIAALRDFIAQNVDIIILNPVAKTGWTTVLGEAKAAGIPVILLDQLFSEDESLYAAYVSYDFEAQGRKIAETLVALKGTGIVNILELEGPTGNTAAIGRKKGFDAVIAQHASYTIVQSTPVANWSQAQGQTETTNAIAAHSDINVVYGHNDGLAFGAIDAITAIPGGTVGTGTTDITILGIDCGKAALQSIFDGKIYASCECSPFLGPLVVEMCKQVLEGTLKSKTVYMDDLVYKKADLTQAFIDARGY